MHSGNMCRNNDLISFPAQISRKLLSPAEFSWLLIVQKRHGIKAITVQSWLIAESCCHMAGNAVTLA